MELGEKLKTYRKNVGMSQQAVCEYLKISRQSISKWENGRGYPEIDNLILLSELYKVSIDDLLKDNQQLNKKSNNKNNPTEEKNQKLKIIKYRIEKNLMKD